jgi:hypothetical protein
MDHRTIDAESIAERYVTRRLAPEEEALFEEHLLDCPACCTRVESAERLQRGLRRLSEEAAAGAAAGPLPARWSRSPRLALAAAALLALALLPAGLELRQVQGLRADLDAARREVANSRTAHRTAPSDADAQLDQARRDLEDHATPAEDAQRQLTADLESARRELATQDERRQGLERELAAGRRAQADLPVVALTPVRGGASGGPVRTLVLPAEPGWVALWVEPGDADFPAYRATLRDVQGKAVFTAGHLPLNELGALLLVLHSTSLSPGAYRLEIDGLPPAGAPVPLDRHALRVTSR